MAHQLKLRLFVNWKRSLLAALMVLSGAAAGPLATRVTSSSVTPVSPIEFPYPGVRDEVAMVLVGTALIGLGSAVRRVG